MVAPLDLLDRQIVELVEEIGAAVEQDVVFAVADLHRAGGEDDVLRVDGVADLAGRDVERLAFLEVEIDGDEALLAAVGQGNGGALDLRQRAADEVEALVVELGFAAASCC